MTGTLVAACALVAMVFVTFVGVIKAISDHKAQQEHDKIQRELNDEIYSGGNVARIASLRKRMLELEDAGCRRR